MWIENVNESLTPHERDASGAISIHHLLFVLDRVFIKVKFYAGILSCLRRESKN